MATKTCVNGHIYDPNVYGDNCPFCPSVSASSYKGSAETRINGDASSTVSTSLGGEKTSYTGTQRTIPVNLPLDGVVEAGGGTVIRHLDGQLSGAASMPSGNRRLVGLLVCYDQNPLGEVFHVYEGKNTVGRKATEDIVLAVDSQISSEHLVILYREVEGIFWAIDNNSSNGTFVNGNFQDKAQLNPNDVITIGNTRLIFLPIPRLPKL